ncbi:hypothetical protein ACOSP7_017423 [Xanthoceras sorbifolium]
MYKSYATWWETGVGCWGSSRISNHVILLLSIETLYNLTLGNQVDTITANFGKTCLLDSFDMLSRCGEKDKIIFV